MAKRIAQSSINWASLAERVPAGQKSNFIVFKSKCDGYLRRVLANPPESPQIDWAHYKNKIPNAALVDNLQKQYQGLQIPYPKDTATALVEKDAEKIRKNVSDFKADATRAIAEHRENIARLEALLPYDQMTLEDFADAHPELAIDTENRPTFWPHLDEAQPAWRAQQAALEGKPAEAH